MSDVTPETLVNLNRYPVLELAGSKGQDFLATCREQIRSVGCCALREFVNPAYIGAMAGEAARLAPRAYHSTVNGNAYLEPIDPTLESNHPKRRTDTTSLGAVAYDQIPKATLIRQLYEWNPLVELLAQILQKPKLYRYNDSLSALNIAVMKEGDYLRWHFDQTDFVTSIALQDSEEGGDFEFVPMIRTAREERYEKVCPT
ncbi:MAG: hypothetical protein HYR96_07560 [Deltaproteobacteria bacterium]|nr:hypothetical protein [Deltaproteobacteria bacterium]MBI3296282.1 hypothetical protein [Deltaproteobacteria bacterium]